MLWWERRPCQRMARLLLTCTEADVSTTSDSLGRGGAAV